MLRKVVPAFFAGVFAANSIPHLAKGTTGDRHQTPRHFGDTAVANAVWGWANVAASVVIWRFAVADRDEVVLGAAGVGSLISAAGLAHSWSRHPERNRPRGQ